MNINCSCSNSVVFEGKCKGSFINQTSSSCVDQKCSWTHLFDGVLIDEVVVVFIEGAMEGHAVRFKKKILNMKFLMTQIQYIGSFYESYLQCVDPFKSQRLLNTVW